jgi:polyisoprenoid-binding protein YceI
MKSNKNVGTPSSTTARRRIAHEAEGGASGALVGAIVGVSAGPPGAIAGAIMGGIAGALAGAVIDQEASARELRMRELDEGIGVSGGDLEAPELEYPQATSFAPREAAPSEPAPVEEPWADGVDFWVRHLMLATIHGRFTTWRGALLFDEQAPENSRLEVEIDAASIDTKEPRRDAHLRSADFFDVEKYPKLVFRSTKVERAGDHFKVTGGLTMRGVTRLVTLDVEYADRAKHRPMGERAGFFARGSLNRKDWGLNWNQILDTGGLAIGDTIEIHLGIEATKAS